MGQLNGTRLLNALVAWFSPTDDTDRALVGDTYGKVRPRLHVTDGGTAGTAQTATTFWTNDTGGPMTLDVKSATDSGGVFITPVAVTANASNNLTLTVDRVDAAGANATTMATYTSDVAGGSTVAGVPKMLTPSATAGNITVPAGWSVRVAVSKGGTGVAMAAATSQAYVVLRFRPGT